MPDNPVPAVRAVSDFIGMRQLFITPGADNAVLIFYLYQINRNLPFFQPFIFNLQILCFSCNNRFDIRFCTGTVL